MQDEKDGFNYHGYGVLRLSTSIDEWPAIEPPAHSEERAFGQFLPLSFQLSNVPVRPEKFPLGERCLRARKPDRKCTGQ